MHVACVHHTPLPPIRQLIGLIRLIHARNTHVYYYMYLWLRQCSSAEARANLVDLWSLSSPRISTTGEVVSVELQSSCGMAIFNRKSASSRPSRSSAARLERFQLTPNLVSLLPLLGWLETRQPYHLDGFN